MRVRFDDLPLAVRQRFVAISTAGTDPKLVWFRPIGSMYWANWVFGILGLLGAGWALVFVVQRAFVVPPSSDVEMYATMAGCVAAFLASLLGIVYRSIWKPPPFKEGFYLTGGSLVRAQGPWLDVMPLDQVGRPQITHYYRNGSYQRSTLALGGVFLLSYRSKTDVDESWQSIVQTAARYKAVLGARDGQAMASIDPFVECTMSGQWVQASPEPPRVPVVPTGAKIARWAGALVVGAGFAGVLFLALDLGLESERAAEQKRLSPRPGAPYTPPRR